MFFIPDSFIDELIGEDLGLIDVTTEAMGVGGVPGVIECFPKRGCTVAGIEEAAKVFGRVGLKPEVLCGSGYELAAETIIMRVEGGADQLCAVYKVAQNIMEYASGIATRCAQMVRNARKASPHIEVAVTRKHFPGTKRLSVSSALAGGASVHRLGLYDSVLVFDQHRVFTGDTAGFLPIVKQMADRLPEKKIAVEANSPEEAIAFADAGADVVQCDKFSVEELNWLVPRLREINGNLKILSAGGMNADNAFGYAATGVDVLVTSWVYFGKPEDIKMKFSAK
ncbi:ModD protein [Synergistales bacterium]|nr:ModD protein [Synergistales bacterium]